MSNNSWLRVLGIVVLSLLIFGSVAFAAYRIGFNQGAGLLAQGVQPPRLVNPSGEINPDGQIFPNRAWFGRHMPMYEGRFFHPMMRLGWHFFHPGFWLGTTAFVLIVFLLVKAFSNQPAPKEESSSRRSTRR